MAAHCRRVCSLGAAGAAGAAGSTAVEGRRIHLAGMGKVLARRVNKTKRQGFEDAAYLDCTQAAPDSPRRRALFAPGGRIRRGWMPERAGGRGS